MTQPTFDGIPIADMDNIFILNIEQGSWKYGYVFNGDFYLHRYYQRGTYNKVRADLAKCVNQNLPISDWYTQWEKVHTNNLVDMEMFSYTTGVKVSIGQMRQSKAIAMISAQIVEEPVYKQSNDSSTVLGKSDEEIMSDIASGVLQTRPMPEEAIDEPPIMAAGALADAGLLNSNIGLPADLLRAAKWPAYWKFIPPGWSAIDTYRLGEMFPVADPSGRILHARKKLLVPGVRTGGKSMYKDIKEARDTLSQWLEDNPDE